MEHKIVFTDKVYLENLDDYEYENVKSTVFPLFDSVIADNGWDKGFFGGKKVAVKPNLLHKTGVEKCVTTHPSYTRAACEYFTSLGASVVVCDSPGGVYNKTLVEGVAKETGTLEAASLGGRLRDALERKPVISKDKCVGCGICKNNCPVDAITILNKKAKIDKTKCIKCYCCQEFCPKLAVAAKNIFGI